MITGFEKIIEIRIKNAQKRGEFDNLPCAGKPLRDRNDNVPEELRLAHKILKNAGYLPPEIELKKEIKHTQDLLAGMKKTSEQYKIMKKLNFLIMKLNATRNTSVMSEMPQQYMPNLITHLKSK